MKFIDINRYNLKYDLQNATYFFAINYIQDIQDIP